MALTLGVIGVLCAPMAEVTSGIEGDLEAAIYANEAAQQSAQAVSAAADTHTTPSQDVTAAETTEIDDDLEAAFLADQSASQAVQTASAATGGFSNAAQVAADALNMGFTIDVGAFGFSAENHRHHGGHMSNHNGPYIQGVEWTAGAAIDPFFRFDLQYNLAHTHFEEITVETTALPWSLKLRAGQFRTKLGRHNDRCLHQWHFVDHTLSTDYVFSAEGMSLPGIELSWIAPLPWYVSVIGAVQGVGQNRSQLSEDIQGIDDLIFSPRIEQYVEMGETLSLMVGLNASFAHSPYPSDPTLDNRSYLYGADLTWKWVPEGMGRRSITWTTEGWYRELEVPQDVWRDAGGVSELAMVWSASWQTAVRGEIWRRIDGDEPVQRVQSGSDSVRGELSVSYTPSHFSRVRLQYGVEDIEGYDVNHLLALQLEVSAGAHGAHTW